VRDIPPSELNIIVRNDDNVALSEVGHFYEVVEESAT
jgi:hypothetical protein